MWEGHRGHTHLGAGNCVRTEFCEGTGAQECIFIVFFCNYSKTAKQKQHSFQGVYEPGRRLRG